MKILSTLFIAGLVSFSCFAQFPAPSNLTFTYEYNNDEFFGVVCNGENIDEYHYCTHFSWEHADTLGTDSEFIHYVLYHVKRYNEEDTIVLATTTKNNLELDFGLLGWAWVTAVYENPDGESRKSNLIENFDLPIGVSELAKSSEPQVLFDSDNYTFSILNHDLVKMIYFYNMNGKLITSSNSFSGKKQIHLIKGLHIVEMLLTDNRTIKQKILVL